MPGVSLYDHSAIITMVIVTGNHRSDCLAFHVCIWVGQCAKTPNVFSLAAMSWMMLAFVSYTCGTECEAYSACTWACMHLRM